MIKRKAARSGDGDMPTRTSHADLAAEAAEWDNGRRTPSGFVDADDAAPRAHPATAISLRLPAALLTLLKKFAAREGIGYQVLLKRWLDDRLRIERERMRETSEDRRATPPARAPQFPLRDRAGDATHYQPLH